MNSLEALKEIKDKYKLDRLNIFDECRFKIVEGDIKALEILKSNLFFRLTKKKSGGCYLEIDNTQNKEVMMLRITQEDFDLLKKELEK